jgi:predicted 3-demethylubiquinone-9 3-methyltransferase (glyoxalase superfamily)
MFPPLAEQWWAQVQDQTPWDRFGPTEFARLKNKYGVSWVVVQAHGSEGLDCAYQNDAVRVCRLP